MQARKPKFAPLMTGIFATCWAVFAVACSGTDAADQTPISETSMASATWEMPDTRPLLTDPNQARNLADNELAAIEPAAVEKEVRAAYQHRYESYWDCLRSPMACDESYLWPAGEAAQHMRAVRTEMVARDRFVGPEKAGYQQIEGVRISADRLTAEVTACWWSTAVLYGAPIYPDLPVGPDNPSTHVTSTPEGGRQRDRFMRSGDRWLLVSTEALDAGFAQDPCLR